MRNSMKEIRDYKDWRRNDFEFEDEPLGKGGFGTVYRAKCIKPDFGNKLVAIKKISQEKLVKDKKLRKYVEKEIAIHKKLHHPNIVEFYATFEDENFVYLVLELCHQPLSTLLKEGKVPEVIAVNIIEQVVQGMLYLHKQRILHRDISIGNILLTIDKKVKICDLGFVTLEGKALTTVLGTPHFISPEIKNGQPYNYLSDSYSLGVVIFAVLGGKLPMNKNSIDTDDYFTPEAVELMKALLEEEPENRVGIDGVLGYQFFSKYRDQPKAKNRNKDSGMGSINSSSSSGKNQYRSSKYFDSGLDSSNSSDKELKRSHWFSKAYIGDPKTYWRTQKEDVSQNYKESSKRRYIPNYENQTLNCRKYLPQRISPTFHSTHSGRKVRSVSEERRRQELTNHNSDRQCLSNYETQTLHSRNNLPQRARPTFHSTHSNRNERSVSEERRRQEITYNNNTTQNRSNEARTRHCSPHESEPSKYSYNIKSNTQAEKCNVDFCKFKSSILEDSNHQSPLLLVSERNISQDKNTQNHQESLALNSKHSSRSDQSRKNLPPKKSQHGSSVEQKPQRLNAERLGPSRYHKKTAVVSILENEDVCVEWLKNKNKKQIVSQVLLISKNDVIYAYQPKPCLLGDKPPPKPGNPEEMEDFIYDKLPSRYWRMYRMAKKIVDFIRACTPKITCFKENFKFVMMENYPDPDCDMEFFDGTRIKQVSNKVSVFDNSGTIVEDMDHSFKEMHRQFMDMKAWCRKVEAHLETLNITLNYPIMFGNSAKYNSKKNISP